MTPEEALQNPNVTAFLHAIRLGEGTADELGYNRIVGGELFESFADHPRKRVRITGYNVWSTAAGAYQFLSSTWDDMARKYHLPDFSPHSQDLAAVGLIIRRKALNDVLAGRIPEAIDKCHDEWASLPGSQYGQRTESLAAVLAEYAKYGGVLASESPTELAEAPPAPITESAPSWEAPVNPFLIAALPQLIQEIPELIRSFGKGEVTERNAKAVESLFKVVQTATGTPNAQAAVEAIKADPQLKNDVRNTLEANSWFDTTEAGGGGIEGARAFNIRAAEVSPWRLPVVWVTLAFLPLIYAVVLTPLFKDGYSGELRGLVIGAVVGTLLAAIVAFFYGTVTRSRQAVQGD